MEPRKIYELETAYAERARNLFTQDNIASIVYYLNKQIPNIFPLTKESEFSTLVNAAQIDGMKKLIELVQTSVLGNKKK